MNRTLDNTDRRIVELLGRNARLSMKEIGAAVSMTGQAVRNRLDRLEDMGLLQRYTIVVNCPVFGYQLHVLLQMRCSQGAVARVRRLLGADGLRLRHSYRSTGGIWFVDLHVRNMDRLNELHAALQDMCECDLHIILDESDDLEPDGAFSGR